MCSFASVCVGFLYCASPHLSSMLLNDADYRSYRRFVDTTILCKYCTSPQLPAYYNLVFGKNNTGDNERLYLGVDMKLMKG